MVSAEASAVDIAAADSAAATVLRLITVEEPVASAHSVAVLALTAV